MKFASLLIALAALACTAAAYRENVALKQHWTRAAVLPEKDFVIEFRVPLKQRNMDVLEKMVLERADPTSKLYTQWLSPAEVDALVLPEKRDVKRVVSWLLAGGITNVDASRGDVIICRASVGAVERLLKADFEYFVHKKTEITRLRTLKYSTPSELDDIIDFVAGISEFWVPPPLHALAADEETLTMADGKTLKNDVTSGYIIPDAIRNIYGIPKNAFRDVSAKSSLATIEFQDAPAYEKSDLTAFEQGTGEMHIKVGHTVGPFQQGGNAESALDIQYASAIGLNSTYWFWTEQKWMLDFAQDLYNKQKSTGAPHVVSMSWGWPTNEQCQISGCSNGDTSQQYAQRVDKEWLKVTSTGITLCASSGDQGAPGDGNSGCFNHQHPLSDIYPGASPWVTSVGATMLTPGQAPSSGAYPKAPVCNGGQYQCGTGTKESVCTTPGALITTGGGFSTMSPVPTWQSSIVSSYLSSGVALPPASSFNASNRGFPDVSANGHAYLINMGGNFMQVDGTSCSSPVFAGMVTLFNGNRIDAGKNALGFINPALYKLQSTNPAAFNPFSSGNNKCTESSCCKAGFEATGSVAWNPVVGLGTPNFPALLSYFASLP